MTEPSRTSIPTQIYQGVFSAVFTILLPELRHLKDADDQWAALMIIGLAQPKWLRWALNAAALICLLLGLVAGTWAAGQACRALGIERQELVLVVWGAGLIAGVSVAMLFFFWCDSMVIRRACRTLIHNLGHLICSECGYSMVGHAGSNSVTCPECGTMLSFDEPTDDSLR